MDAKDLLIDLVDRNNLCHKGRKALQQRPQKLITAKAAPLSCGLDCSFSSMSGTRSSNVSTDVPHGTADAPNL